MTGPKFSLSVFITAIDRITAPIQRINSRIGRLTAPVRALGNQFASLWQTAGGTDVVDRVKAVGSAVSDVGTAAMTAGRRFLGVTAAAGGLAYLFKREFIDTAAEFENLGISLEGIEGSAAKAERALDFIKTMTVKTPFEMPDIAGAFRLMRAQGMDPMNGSLQAIVDQVAKVGGSGDKLSGVAMQLSQAWSKGRLMAQDANILAENGIPVWAMLSRAVERTNKGQKLSVAQLRKMSENGQLGLKSITLLIEQMGLESQGASARMMKSWTGMISNIRDNWTFFKLQVMQSGPFDSLKTKLQGILDIITRMGENGDLKRLAEAIGSDIADKLDAGWKLLNEDLIPGVRSLWAWATLVADAFGGWGNFLGLGIAAYIAGPLVASVISLIAAMIMLGVTIGLTPVGWVLAGIGAIALGAVVIMRAWEPLKAFFHDIAAGAIEQLGGVYDFIAGIATFDGKRIGKGWNAVFSGAKKNRNSIYGALDSSDAPELDQGWLGWAPNNPTLPGVPSVFSGQGSASDPAGALSLLGQKPSVADALRVLFGDQAAIDRIRQQASGLGTAPGVTATGDDMVAGGGLGGLLPLLRERSRADINVTVTGPGGTRADVDPRSTADVSLRQRILSGPMTAGAH